jgi:5-methylcytosine-specific restriction endonuclease McrA
MAIHEHLVRIPKPEPKVGLEVQHITLCSNLGHDAEENLITLCWQCHGRA